MFGSSLVRKSNKKFAPKAPARRNLSHASTPQVSTDVPLSGAAEVQIHHTSTYTTSWDGHQDDTSQRPPIEATVTALYSTVIARRQGFETEPEDFATPSTVLPQHTTSDTTRQAQIATQPSDSQSHQLSTPAPSESAISESPSGRGRNTSSSSGQKRAAARDDDASRTRARVTSLTAIVDTVGTGTRGREKRKRIVTEPEDVGGTFAHSGPSAKKPRKVRKDKGTTRRPKDSVPVTPPADSDAAGSGLEIEPLEQEPKRTGRRQSRSSRAVDDIDQACGLEDVDEDEDAVHPARPRRKRNARSPTPEDAEDIEVDIYSMTMTDICTDRREGQVSTREKAMRGVNWDEVNRRRKERLHNPPAVASETETVQNTSHETGADGEDSAATEGRAPDEAFSAGAPSRRPRLRMVDGRMMVDEASTVIDQHAAATAENEVLEMVDEDDLTTQINQHSFMFNNKRDPNDRRLTPNDRWGVEDDEKFYEALGMFGTDFGMIAKMFPGRTRKNIKHKFTREERANPALVRAALVGQVKTALDMEKYLRESDRKEEDLIDPRRLDAELDAKKAEMQPEIEAARKEYSETERQRKIAEGGTGQKEVGAVSDGKGGAPKKKAKKPKKNATRGGEEEIIIETVEDDIPFPSRRRFF